MTATTGTKRKKAAPEARIAKICRMLEAKDTGKAKYGEADQLFAELLPSLKVGERIDLGNGEMFELVDPFLEGKKVWRPVGVSRWDYKVSRAAKPAKSPEIQPMGPQTGPQTPVQCETIDLKR